MYSASIELSENDLYFFLYQETIADPILNIPPNVLFLFDGLPIQYAYVKPWNFIPSICLY